MTDANKTPENGLETPNTPKAISYTEALPTVIEDFVESQINNSRTDANFYVSVVDGRYPKFDLVEKIKKFIELRKSFSGYKDIVNKAFFDSIQNDTSLMTKVRATTLLKGRKIAQLHNAVLHEMSTRYDFSNSKAYAELKKIVRSEHTDTLKRRLKNQDYQDIAVEVLGKNTATPELLDSMLELESQFGDECKNLSKKELKNLARAYETRSLSEENLRPLLEKLGSKGRRKLLEIVSPTLTLDTFVDLGIIDQKTARAKIRKELLESNFLPEEANNPELFLEITNIVNEAVENANLHDFSVATSSIEDATLDLFTKSPKFDQFIGDKLNAIKYEEEKSLRSKNVSTQTTAQELVEDVLPKSLKQAEWLDTLASSVQDGKPVYVIKKTVDKDGQDRSTYFRLENWDDSHRSIDIYPLGVNDAIYSATTKQGVEPTLYTEFASGLEEPGATISFLGKEMFEWRTQDLTKLVDEPEEIDEKPPIDYTTKFGDSTLEEDTTQTTTSGPNGPMPPSIPPGGPRGPKGPNDLEFKYDTDENRARAIKNIQERGIELPENASDAYIYTLVDAPGNQPISPEPVLDGERDKTHEVPGIIDYTYSDAQKRVDDIQWLRDNGHEVADDIPDGELIARREKLKKDLAEEAATAEEQASRLSDSNDSNETRNVTVTLAQLLSEINDIDSEGASHGLAVWTVFMTTEPGKWGNDFGLLKIASIIEPQDGVQGKIKVTDELTEEVIELSFNDFFVAFRGKSNRGGPHSKRISPISDAESFLTNIKINHSSKVSFDDVTFDAENGKFVESNRKGESNYEGTRFFMGLGFAVHILENDGTNVKINLYSNIDKKKDDTITWDPIFEEKVISYQALATLFLRYELTPSKVHRDGIKPIQTQTIDETKTKPGHIKHWFGKLSINDVLHGGKQFVDFIKEKIAHGNHLQEARVMLMLGRGIGLDKKNSDWYYDLKAKVENNEKKLVEERLEELGKMGGTDRQRSVYDSLMNNGSHDYEHWASVFSMLEKHGTLYVGKELRSLEGSYIFFKRVAGLPLGADVAYDKTFQVLKKKLEDAQEPVTEEGIIREYMKSASADGKFNSLMWLMARGKWASGIKDEMESGKKEGDGIMTLERRVDNAMSKFRENEYSKGIGAALAISDKPGSAALKHTPWVVLAISRKPERFHQDQLQKFVGYYDEGRTHSPALMFIKDPASQQMFRKTIMALCEANDLRKGITDANRSQNMNKSMVADFQAVLDKVNSNEEFDDGSNLSFKKIEAFWKKHGETLQPQLTQSARDPVMIYEAANNEAFRAYNDRVNNELGNTNFHATEMDIGTYLSNDANAASIVYAKTDKVLWKIKVNSNGISLHQGDKLSELFLGHFIDAVEDIKKISSTEEEARIAGVTTEALTLKKQKTLYAKLHEEFYKFSIRETGQNYSKFWAGSNDDDKKKYAPPFESLFALGFHSDPDKSIYSIKEIGTDTYKKQLNADFAAFMSGSAVDDSNALADKVRSRVSGNIF